MERRDKCPLILVFKDDNLILVELPEDIHFRNRNGFQPTGALTSFLTISAMLTTSTPAEPQQGDPLPRTMDTIRQSCGR